MDSTTRQPSETPKPQSRWLQALLKNSPRTTNQIIIMDPESELSVMDRDNHHDVRLNETVSNDTLASSSAQVGEQFSGSGLRRFSWAEKFPSPHQGGSGWGVNSGVSVDLLGSDGSLVPVVQTRQVVVSPEVTARAEDAIMFPTSTTTTQFGSMVITPSESTTSNLTITGSSSNATHHGGLSNDLPIGPEKVNSEPSISARLFDTTWQLCKQLVVQINGEITANSSCSMLWPLVSQLDPEISGSVEGLITSIWACSFDACENRKGLYSEKVAPRLIRNLLNLCGKLVKSVIHRETDKAKSDSQAEENGRLEQTVEGRLLVQTTKALEMNWELYADMFSDGGVRDTQKVITGLVEQAKRLFKLRTARQTMLQTQVPSNEAGDDSDNVIAELFLQSGWNLFNTSFQTAWSKEDAEEEVTMANSPGYIMRKDQEYYQLFDACFGLCEVLKVVGAVQNENQRQQSGAYKSSRTVFGDAKAEQLGKNLKKHLNREFENEGMQQQEESNEPPSKRPSSATSLDILKRRVEKESEATIYRTCPGQPTDQGQGMNQGDLIQHDDVLHELAAPQSRPGPGPNIANVIPSISRIPEIESSDMHISTRKSSGLMQSIEADESGNIDRRNDSVVASTAESYSVGPSNIINFGSSSTRNWAQAAAFQPSPTPAKPWNWWAHNQTQIPLPPIVGRIPIPIPTPTGSPALGLQQEQTGHAHPQPNTSSPPSIISTTASSPEPSMHSVDLADLDCLHHIRLRLLLLKAANKHGYSKHTSGRSFPDYVREMSRLSFGKSERRQKLFSDFRNAVLDPGNNIKSKGDAAAHEASLVQIKRAVEWKINGNRHKFLKELFGYVTGVELEHVDGLAEDAKHRILVG